ncbi:MAG: site-specific integrase [Micropruina sp.]|uniref:site-specific integrase n=1 Tax=Micropruina sp. TaxID=2737536 RepID=UPI0039E556C5
MTISTTEQGARPPDPLKLCASCGLPRGNQRRGWEPITRGDGTVRGWTCPACPRADEPIRRLAGKTGTVRFRVVVDATPPGAPKRRQVTRTLPTLDAARAVVEQVRAEVARAGEFAAPAALTFTAYADKWLPRRQTTGKRPLSATTAAEYRRYLTRDIGPSALGRMKLADIRRSDVVRFLDGLTGDGRGAPTVTRILTVVQSVLSGAVRDELCPVNVARGVEAPTVAAIERHLWEPAQLAAFLRVAGEHRLGALFEFTLHTALRRGEVCGLRWRDVDLTRGTAQIVNNRVLAGNRATEHSPKTDASATGIELPAAAVAALKGWKVRQDIERSEAGDAWSESGHVFTREGGQPLNPGYVTKLFRKLAGITAARLAAEQRDQDAEPLPPLTLHGLRHIAASYMYDATGDLLAVSKALRHANTSVTQTVYTHMRQGKQRETFGAIAAQLQGSGAPAKAAAES